MSDTPCDSAPAVPEIVRTVAYFATAIETPIAACVVTIIGVVAPHALPPASIVAGAVTACIATIAGVFGVIYRPTKSPASGD